jgi:hypothetical protein
VDVFARSFSATNSIMPLSPERFKAALRRLGFWDGIWFGGGLWGAWQFVVNGKPLGALVALLCLPPALLLLTGHRWAWHASVLAWAGFLMITTRLAAESGFEAGWIAVLLALAVGLAVTLVFRARFLAVSSPAVDEPVDDPTAHSHSLVLWLREPLLLDDTRLAEVAARAFRRPFNEKGGNCFLIGKGVNHVMRVEDLWFLVLHIERPYLDDPAHAAQLPPETLDRAAALQHGAWLAIDLMTAAPDLPVGKIEDTMGRFLAEAAAEAAGEPVAILHPSSGRLLTWAPGFLTELASGDPLSIFGPRAG